MKPSKEIRQLEKEARSQVSQENLQEHIEFFCSLGEKLAGNPEEAQACEYIVDRLKEAGLKPRVHTFESYVSHPGKASFRVDFPEKQEVEGVGVSFSLGTPETGLSGEVVHVKGGTEAEYRGLHVAGKIVLVDKLPSPERTEVAWKHGAAAMVCLSEGPMRHKMITTPVWGTPSLEDKDKIPRLPVVSISGDDGAPLRRMARAGTLRGTVMAEVWEGWKTLRVPEVIIPGTRPEFILVGGHYCSWFDGATDNATGNSSMIELARLFAKYRKSLKYGVRLAWWPGHSNGRYSGSTWFADTFWQELYDDGVVYFNIDSPGVRGATIYVPRHQMAEVSEFNEGCVAELTDWATNKSADAQLAIGRRAGKAVDPSRPSRAADQSFWGIGLTSIGVYSMLPPDHPDRRKEVGGSGGAWWWHSVDDTVDKADSQVLAQDTRLYFSIIHRLATARVLPFNFGVTVQDYQDVLQEYQQEAGKHFSFEKLANNLKTLKAKVSALNKRVNSLKTTAEAEGMNRFFLKLARVLNPVLYTSVEPTSHQPALGTRMLPDLAGTLTLKSLDPESNDYKFLQAQLFRKVNKINFRVLEAIRMLEERD